MHYWYGDTTTILTGGIKKHKIMPKIIPKYNSKPKQVFYEMNMER